MFQEVERTYRTAQEEELTWNINFLKIMIIILLISSCSLLVYLIFHSILFRFPGIYGIFFLENSISTFFMTVFNIIATYVTYPITIVLAIIFIKLIKYFPRKEKRKLLAAAIILLSVLGLSIIFGLIRAIYFVSAEWPTVFEGYNRLNTANIIISFFKDYLAFALAMIMLSLLLGKQKRSGGYVGYTPITPYLQLSLTAIWLVLVIIYYSIFENHIVGKLVITTAVFACVTSAMMIAMYAEILVKLKNVNIPQIIVTKEKLP